MGGHWPAAEHDRRQSPPLPGYEGIENCPHSSHAAPDPTDGPTSCPCGRVTRHPAPTPKESPRG